MSDRIVRARTLRACTYRSPDGTWHRDYPADWEGPMKRAHFDQLEAKGEASRVTPETAGDPQ
ncbi:MAG: hypothetical protein IPK75_01355 [Acidobacteria bacterium]|nr:hypothetical protein [Acidobacteriota bacterium]